jgi:hypothetical protein
LVRHRVMKMCGGCANIASRILKCDTSWGELSASRSGPFLPHVCYCSPFGWEAGFASKPSWMHSRTGSTLRPSSLQPVTDWAGRKGNRTLRMTSLVIPYTQQRFLSFPVYTCRFHLSFTLFGLLTLRTHQMDPCSATEYVGPDVLCCKINVHFCYDSE